jgi:hypothetical protein
MNTCLYCGKEIEKGDMCAECRKEDNISKGEYIR